MVWPGRYLSLYRLPANNGNRSRFDTTTPPVRSRVTAKAWALGGDRQGCYRHLSKAVDLGWLRDADHLREIWPEFFWNPNLEEVPEWQILAQRLGAAENQQGT